MLKRARFICHYLFFQCCHLKAERGLPYQYPFFKNHFTQVSPLALAKCSEGYSENEQWSLPPSPPPWPPSRRTCTQGQRILYTLFISPCCTFPYLKTACLKVLHKVHTELGTLLTGREQYVKGTLAWDFLTFDIFIWPLVPNPKYFSIINPNSLRCSNLKLTVHKRGRCFLSS